MSNLPNLNKINDSASACRSAATATGRNWVIISPLNVLSSINSFIQKACNAVFHWRWIHFFFFWNSLIVLGTSVPQLRHEGSSFSPTSLSQICHPISERLMNSRFQSRSDIDILLLIITLRLMSCSISCSFHSHGLQQTADFPPYSFHLPHPAFQKRKFESLFK